MRFIYSTFIHFNKLFPFTFDCIFIIVRIPVSIFDCGLEINFVIISVTLSSESTFLLGDFRLFPSINVVNFQHVTHKIP